MGVQAYKSAHVDPVRVDLPAGCTLHFKSVPEGILWSIIGAQVSHSERLSAITAEHNEGPRSPKKSSDTPIELTSAFATLPRAVIDLHETKDPAWYNAGSLVSHRAGQQVLSTAAARRRLRPSDVFTASFSAVLATATVLDTRKKDERLLQWDQAIEEVRSGKDLATISTPDQVSIGKAADESSNIMGHEVVEYTPDANICRKLEEGATTVRQLVSVTPMPIASRSRESMTPVWDELRAILRIFKRAGSWHEIIEANLLQEHTSEISPVAVESDRRLLQGSEFAASTMSHWSPRTTKQLEQMERNVNALVHELWQGATKPRQAISRRRVQSDYEIDTELDSSLESSLLNELLIPMLDGSTPAPEYPKVRSVGIASDPTHLNATLRSIINGVGSNAGDFDLMIAKICYNLLTSKSVPDVATYEILIRGFMNLGEPDLADVAIRRFKENPLRPDEGILSAMLVHYGRARDSEMFYTTVRQMAGMEDGLRLERHHVFDLNRPAVQRWALEKDIIHREGYLHEKAHRNSDIFESLIRGCMNFHNLDGALRYLKIAIKEGCYIRTHVFTDIVYYSLTCPERTSALLRIVTALSWQFGTRKRSGGGLDYNSDVRGSIYDVLEACGLGSALSGGVDASETLRDVQHPLVSYIYPTQFAAMIQHFHEEEAKDMASYRAQGVPLLHRAWVQRDGGGHRMRIEDIPNEYSRMLIADTPSFLKMSKLVGDEGDEAFMEASQLDVDESNFRPMAATSGRTGPLSNENADEGPLAGCF
ncbi:hypothetical protein V493_03804 [Pseudogymnoascus sp. VKM F-4281 (FW-2241)]|nr:hypothetical protein V493_03804 [Pseudogymnoascus sp. VKM F-4281 (FW-2241)]